MGGAASAALAIKVTADAKQARSELASATQTTSKLGRAGQVAGRLLAAGLLVAAGAAVKFTQAAAEDAQASAQLAQTAQQSAGATKAQTAAMEDWISAQGRAKGVSDDELRPAMSKLITVTHSISAAQKLSSLAMDISARTGKSLESVTQSLAKAQTGSVAGLAKYQVQTKDAAGKTRSLADVQRDLAKAYSGSAATAAGTAAGKAKVLAVQMDELQESIGTKLLPVMLKLTSAGLGVVDWISKNQTAALAIIGALGGLLAIIKAVSLAQQAWSAAQAAWSAATKVATAVQAAFNFVMAANPVVLVVIAVVALIAVLVLLYKRSETARTIINAAFGAISKAAGAAVDFIRDHWRLILSILGGPVGLAVALISKHWDTIKAGGAAVVGWIQDKWPAIKAVIVTPFQTAKTAISDVWDKIQSGATTAKTAIGDVVGGIVATFNTIRDAVQSVVDKVQALIDKIKSIPHPNLPDLPGVDILPRLSVGRTSGGQTAAAAGPSVVQLHVHLEGQGGHFIGNELEFARMLKQVLGDDLRRLFGPGAQLVVTS